MAKTLNPESDLLFKANSKVKISNNNFSKHLRKRGGTDIVDADVNSPFTDAGMHVCGRKKIIQEKLDSMADAILSQDWIRFDTLFFEVKELGVSKNCLESFAQEQIKNTMARNPIVEDLTVIKRKLIEIGASEKSLSIGYNEGYKIFKSLYFKK